MAAKKQLEEKLSGSDSNKAIESIELDLFFGDSGGSDSDHESEDSDWVP